MAKKRGPEEGWCPKCHRRTYSAKYRTCSACDVAATFTGGPTLVKAPKATHHLCCGVPVADEHKGTCRALTPQQVGGGTYEGGERPAPQVQPTVTFVGERPEIPGVVRENVELVPGEPCPLCGKKVGRRTVRRQEADDGGD